MSEVTTSTGRTFEDFVVGEVIQHRIAEGISTGIPLYSPGSTGGFRSSRASNRIGPGGSHFSSAMCGSSRWP